MKLWITAGPSPPNPNPNRGLPNNTLLIKRHCGFPVRRLHLPRSLIRMTYPKPPHKRGLPLLHIYFPPHRTRPILRLLRPRKHMKCRSHNALLTNSHGIHGLCPPLRTNIILRSNRNHQPAVCYPIHRRHHCTVNLGGTLRRQCNTHTLHRPSLPPPIRPPGPAHHPPDLFTRTRVFQPPRTRPKRRQNPIPPLLHTKRRPRSNSSRLPTTHPRLIPSDPTKRPGKLHPSKPHNHPITHQARMILPIRLCHPTIHPKQTWRRTSHILLHLYFIPSTRHSHNQTTTNIRPPPIPTPILSPHLRLLRTHMNRGPTSKPPIHPSGPNRLLTFLHRHPHPHTHTRVLRKQNSQTLINPQN